MLAGTLLAYTLVSVSVLILRYQPSLHEPPIPMAHRLDPIAENSDQEETMIDSEDVFADPDKAKRQFKDDQGLLNGDAGAAPPRWYGALPFSSSTIESKLAMLQRHAKMLWLRLGFPSDDALPNDSTAKTAIIFVGLLGLSELVTCLLLVFAESALARGAVWAVLLLLIAIAAVIVCMVFIVRQPQNRRKIAFMAPAVPFLPSLAMFMNIYLMLKLPTLTWARLGIWICIGLLLYFSYSMWHSNKERKHQLKEEQRQQSAPAATAQTTNVAEQTILQSHAAESANQIPTNPSYNSKPVNGYVGANDAHPHMTSQNKVTSPPGAPPSRPPPPRQESIEKYLRTSTSGSAEEQLGSRGRTAPHRESSDEGVRNTMTTATFHAQHNEHDSSSSGQRPLVKSTQQQRHRSNVPSKDVYVSADARRQQAETRQQQQQHSPAKQRPRKLPEHERDPFAHDDRQHDRNMTSRRQHQQQHASAAAPGRKVTSQQTPVKYEYSSSMARPRPRASARHNSLGSDVMPSTATADDAQSRSLLQSDTNTVDPFSNIEDQW